MRAPVCDPPPIPPKLLESCKEPEQLLDGTFQTLYLQMIRDMGPWGECIRNHEKLVEVVRYRDAVCDKLKPKQPEKKK